MSGLDLDALETKAAERVSAMADAEAANRAFEEARAACRAGGCFSVWGRSYTGDEAALNATLSTARDAKHAADVRALTAQVAWERAAPGEAADMVTALITRLRAAEARTAWQPIETAPPGEWLAGLHGDRSKPPHVVMRIPTDVTALGFHDEHGNRIRGLTHWQPLPAPPASEVPRG